MAKVSPISLLLSLLLTSAAVCLMSYPGVFIALAAVLLLPFCFRINILRLLWKMKVMLITALLIFVFALLGGKDLLSSLAESARFLSVIALSALYIEKTDLMELSSSIGTILSPLPNRIGWGFSSSLMMTLAIFPIIIASSGEMLAARKSRGESFFRHPLSALTDYTVSMMRILFQKIMIFQDAMYSRLWTPKGERTPYRLSSSDWICIFMSLLLFVGFIVWKKLS